MSVWRSAPERRGSLGRAQLSRPVFFLLILFRCYALIAVVIAAYTFVRALR